MEDKIIIEKHLFRSYGYLNSNILFSSEEELKNIINNYFEAYLYKNINLYKSVNRRSIKIGRFENYESDFNCHVICEKKYINLFKNGMNLLGYNMLKPDGGKNSQRVLK